MFQKVLITAAILALTYTAISLIRSLIKKESSIEDAERQDQGGGETL
ncbi:MAG: hypothetical protein Q4F41_09655 [Eubacteriales bacterium]|nr:hypothetical protein [Eubacteriales bacterium]